MFKSLLATVVLSVAGLGGLAAVSSDAAKDAAAPCSCCLTCVCEECVCDVAGCECNGECCANGTCCSAGNCCEAASSETPAVAKACCAKLQ